MIYYYKTRMRGELIANGHYAINVTAPQILCIVIINVELPILLQSPPLITYILSQALVLSLSFFFFGFFFLFFSFLRIFFALCDIDLTCFYCFKHVFFFFF